MCFSAHQLYSSKANCVVCTKLFFPRQMLYWRSHLTGSELESSVKVKVKWYFTFIHQWEKSWGSTQCLFYLQWNSELGHGAGRTHMIWLQPESSSQGAHSMQPSVVLTHPLVPTTISTVHSNWESREWVRVIEGRERQNYRNHLKGGGY